MKTYALCCALLLLCACTKTTDLSFLAPRNTAPSSAFTRYTIKKGDHFADRSVYHPVSFNQLRFQVLFDSSAIYRTLSEVNQYDVNKLYGFSDNNSDHHQFSARFGWRWSDGAIRLFAYVYNNGYLSIEELATVQVGTPIECSIRATENEYVFYYGDRWMTVPRNSTTPMAEGYLLYPYFGGDETAPQDIFINIKNL